MKFFGIRPPSGEGNVVEVHIDLINPGTQFTVFLEGQGFEDDPFSVFDPPGYTHHMTGRLRSDKQNLSSVLAMVGEKLEEMFLVGQEEQGFYTEVEWVRGTTYFPEIGRASMENEPLAPFEFSRTGKFGCAKADVHVEFPYGQVTPEVRAYLLGKQFYWVETPVTKYFGAEQIATLQTATFASAREVYEVLSKDPLAGCSGIHLEQKFGMRASNPGLLLPETISVVGRQ